MLAAHPDILHARADERGYALLEIGPRLARCEFRTTPTPAGMGRACRPRPATRSMRAGPECVRTDAPEIPACGVNWATRGVVFVASHGDAGETLDGHPVDAPRSRHDHVRP